MMWLDLTDSALERKQAGVDVWAEAGQQKNKNLVSQNERTNVGTVHIPVPSGSDLMAAFGVSLSWQLWSHRSAASVGGKDEFSVKKWRNCGFELAASSWTLSIIFCINCHEHLGAKMGTRPKPN